MLLGFSVLSNLDFRNNAQVLCLFLGCPQDSIASFPSQP